MVVPGENDLQSHAPELARQWCREKNGGLTPDQVSICSNKRVWWRCSGGHEWKAVIYSRTGAQKCGCPECVGKYKRKR